MSKNKRGQWSHEESLRLQAELPDPNPSGLCHCGCGQETPIASVTMRSRGWVRGKHMRYCHGHSGGKRKREHGETKLNHNGYVLVFMPDHHEANSMGWTFQHRVVMEQKLARLLEPQEVVHHKNEQRTDNRPDNLDLLPNVGAHTSMHAKMNTHWSRAYPELTGCRNCGSSEQRHCARGLCKRCYGKVP